jgi:hypothetical protein
LTKAKAKVLQGAAQPEPSPVPGPVPHPEPGRSLEPIVTPEPEPTLAPQTVTLRLVSTVPPEIWNRLGTKVIPKLRSGPDLTVGINFSVTLNAEVVGSVVSELRQILTDLGLESQLKIEQTLSSSS